MANLANTIAQRGKFAAARVETLQPEAFLDEAEGKPAFPIVVGLRTPNDDDYAKAMAADTDADAMRAIVYVGVCNPNDCRRAHPSFPFPDQQIPIQLKPATIRYLFDRIEQMHLETSPLVPIATDEELFVLGLELESGEALEQLEATNPTAANRIRRLASAIISALEPSE